MKTALLLLSLLAIVALAKPVHDDEQMYKNAFSQFKVKYARHYESSLEEDTRYGIFRANLRYIQAHNADKTQTFTLAVNRFADLTALEFAKQYNGYLMSNNARKNVVQLNTNALPATVDWRTKGAVTGIKNQGQCGSCWAFSTTGSTEGAYFLKTGKLVSLSEQNLVDCSQAQGNQGCEGGLMDQAFQYIISNNGIDTESSYPYTAEDGASCLFNSSNVGATISSYTDVTSGDENALQAAVALTPVSVAIDASQPSFQLYSSGVYNEPACSSSQLDHGVLAIGYGTLNGTPYWLVKNSWGTDWGMQGYIYMSRNLDNQCGIATAASYPIV